MYFTYLKCIYKNKIRCVYINKILNHKGSSVCVCALYAYRYMMKYSNSLRR